MRFLRVGMISFGLAAAFGSASFADPEKINLFMYDKIALDPSQSTGVEPGKVMLIHDGDEATNMPVHTQTTAPVEMLFTFNDETVSPEKLKFKVIGAESDQAKIEIPVSTVSAVSGFTSLRTEPIRDTEDWQSFNFEQTAAKWMIIKIIPFGDEAKLAIAEIDVQGHVGAPVTVYEFNESPADALSLLSSFEGSFELGITEDEASLFKDASDGSFEEWSFAEASLLSSGVYDAQDRKAMLAKIDEMETALRAKLPKEGDAFETGRKILDWLHKNPMKAGYIEGQTDVASILSDKTYNCVSSATLYNILARRFGLDARGIEVPDHAFSILYDGTKHADIETTTKDGFNPARNKAGLTDFAEKTGFVYINDSNRNKRREIDDAGMVALTYYNHGVTSSNEGDYQKALLNYFRALSLDSESKSSVKNALAVLANWSVDLIKDDKLDEALKILELGLDLAPKDRTLRHNLTAVVQRKVDKEVELGHVDAALTLLNDAHEKTEDKSFLRMQSWVFSKLAKQLADEEKWQDALEMTESGLARLHEDAKYDLKKYRSNLILQWSSAKMETNDWGEAVDILERGISFDAIGYKIKNNLAYAAQEWTEYVGETQGSEAQKELALKLGERFPDNRHIQGLIRRSFEQDAAAARDAGDFEKAVEIYAKARAERPNDYQLKKNTHATWDIWANQFMEKRDWPKALDIYERGMAAEPSAHSFRGNVTYIVQEWGRDTQDAEGWLKAEQLIAAQSKRFSDISKISRMGGQTAGEHMSKLIKSRKFEEAAKDLPAAEEFFSSPSKFSDLTLHIYYNWAQEFSDKGEWQKAIDIYTAGYEAYSGNYKLKQNIIAVWHEWAKSYMDKSEWTKAIEIYEAGLAAVPGTSLFKQNIKYCKSKL